MWARIAVRIVDFAERSGCQREPLIADAGLSHHDLTDLDARVPLDAVYRLIEYAAEHTGDVLFGLHFAQQLEVADMDAMGFLMATSPTLGDALDRAMHYFRVWNDGERYALYKDDDQVRITFTPHGRSRPAHRHVAEMTFYDIAVNAAGLIGRELPVRHVRFRHPAPDGSESFDELFGTRVEFRAPTDELVFPARVLALPLPDANAAMCEFFDRYIQENLDVSPPSGLRERARAWIIDHLHESDLTLDALADQLKMSPRTVQRRLHDEGCSMNALVDDVRRERAAAFLGSGVAIAEVAYLLGYSEPSAFHRAFKRWTGQTPEAFRGRRHAAHR